MKNLWSRSAAVLSVASTMVLAGCWESQTPSAFYVEFEKAAYCGSQSKEELTSKYMAPGYGAAQYVEGLVRLRTHPSSAAKLARSCRDWDDAETLAGTKADGSRAGASGSSAARQPGRATSNAFPVSTSRKCTDDKLKIVVGNP